MFRLAVMVKVMMSLAIFLSYALQFYVPVDIINSYLADRVPTENRSSGENFTVSFIADKQVRVRTGVAQHFWTSQIL